MNTNKRHGKLTRQDVVVIKLLLPHMKQTEIAKRFCVQPESISPIATGRYWKDVHLPYIEIARPDPDKHMGGIVTEDNPRCEKLVSLSAGPCIACGKLLIDGIDDDLIYLVAADKFLCKNEKCEQAYYEPWDDAKVEEE